MLRYPRMQALLFHNPSAGQGDHSLRELTGALERAGLSLRVCPSKGEAVARMLEAAPDLVIVAGGDGTVGRIATRMPGRARLAILPFGTANNLARSLGSWRSHATFAEAWRQARHVRLDRAFVESGGERRRFLEAVGFGALARAVDHADKSGAEGIAAGRAAFRTILSHAEPRRFRAVLDGVPWEGESLFAEVMNIPLFGPNLAIAPQAGPGDGCLDLVVLPPERREAMIAWLHAPEQGPPPTVSRRAREILLSWPGGPLRQDDQCHDEALPEEVRLGLEEEPLTVLVPAAAEGLE